MSHGSLGARATLLDGVIDFTGGSLGGVALVYVGQPLDTVKVKMQTFPHMYRNMYDCIKQTIVKEGFFKGLYAGTVPALAANVAENAVVFAAYGACQKVMQFVTNVKVHVGSFRLTQQIIREHGIQGMFRGLTSTIAREMPGYFVFFGGYELTRQLLAPPGKSKEDVGALGTMAAGAVGGMLFWTCIFPADVVKSRIQVSKVDGTLFSLMYKIWQTEGLLALYNGLGPTLIRTVPATAALFLTVETTKKVLHSLTD